MGYAEKTNKIFSRRLLALEGRGRVLETMRNAALFMSQAYFTFWFSARLCRSEGAALF